MKKLLFSAFMALIVSSFLGCEAAPLNEEEAKFEGTWVVDATVTTNDDISEIKFLNTRKLNLTVNGTPLECDWSVTSNTLGIVYNLTVLEIFRLTCSYTFTTSSNLTLNVTKVVVTDQAPSSDIQSYLNKMKAVKGQTIYFKKTQ